MKTFLALVIGLLVGAGGMYWYSNSSPASKMHQLLAEYDENSAEMILAKSEVKFDQAKQNYCNYLSVCDSICPKDSNDLINTRYLNISNDELIALFMRFFKRHKRFDGIRLYPMVYSNQNTGERKNKINLMIVPYKKEFDTETNIEIMKELYLKDKDGKQILTSFNYYDLENQIGQCPPPRNECRNSGSILLDSTMSSMFPMMEQRNSNPGLPLTANNKIPKRVEW